MDLPGWSDGRALLARVIGPALVLWAGLVGIGFALAGPLSGPLGDEVDVDRYLAADRSHSSNTITLLGPTWAAPRLSSEPASSSER